MRRISKTPAGSWVLGRMPTGCKLCIKGAKLVLFVTGLCANRCFYCPISKKRKGRDVVYANERPVRRPSDILEEAKAMGALGTGITGGDPALRFGRVLRYIRLLKDSFGKTHHIHMYCIDFSQRELRKLKEHGVDELRFHSWEPSPVGKALDEGLNAGVELPSIPGKFKEMTRLLSELDEMGCKFVNLNELEFSETNQDELKKRGFVLRSEESVAVKGSEEVALKVLKWAEKNTKLNIHYCPSSLKDGVQLRNRLLRRAVRTAEPYEMISPDGTLWLGIGYGLPERRLRLEMEKLVKMLRLPKSVIRFNERRGRIEMHPELAEFLAEIGVDFKLAIVEEYPTWDRLQTLFIPLGEKDAE